MSKTWFLSVCICLLSLSSFAAEDAELQGIYEVSNAYLNETHCDRDGRPIEYASRFFRVNKTDKGLNIAICNGDSLTDLQCIGGYRSTNLEPSNTAWSGLQYSTRSSGTIENNPSCQLHALRRAIIPMKGDYIRYERTDWSENLRDFIAECTREMAAEYQSAQSLKCDTHISIIAKKVMDLSS